MSMRRPIRTIFRTRTMRMIRRSSFWTEAPTMTTTSNGGKIAVDVEDGIVDVEITTASTRFDIGHLKRPESVSPASISISILLPH